MSLTLEQFQSLSEEDAYNIVKQALDLSCVVGSVLTKNKIKVKASRRRAGRKNHANKRAMTAYNHFTRDIQPVVTKAIQKSLKKEEKDLRKAIRADHDDDTRYEVAVAKALKKIAFKLKAGEVSREWNQLKAKGGKAYQKYLDLAAAGNVAAAPKKRVAGKAKPAPVSDSDYSDSD